MDDESISFHVFLSSDICQLYESVPVPSGSWLSSVIDNVFPTVAVPLIEKVASPLSTKATCVDAHAWRRTACFS